MSKSIGNVIAPKDVLNNYNLEQPDAFRYFMATAAPVGKDGNYSDEDFKNKVNVDLANNIGNLLNRTLNMLVKYFDGEMKEEFCSIVLPSFVTSISEKCLKYWENKLTKIEIVNKNEKLNLSFFQMCQFL